MTRSNSLIGYARVSTKDQKLDSQIDQLKRKGCSKIFSDKISGIKQDRPGWQKLIHYVRPKDIVVITELSRMSRSLAHLLELTKMFEEKEVKIVSLSENIDTTSATGRFFISMMGAISQMEREIKQERIRAGKEAARSRGRSGGRPKMPTEKLEQARILYENSNTSASEICDSLGIGRRTFFYHLSKLKDGPNDCVEAT
jgi:DNA invertase Pin-like site-specific DNA recombinase